MTQQEKFEIWDATHPEIKEVRAYLDRMCGKTPLPLLYLNPRENKANVTRDVLIEEKDRLVGIFLDENTVVYLKSLTKDSISSLYEGDAVWGLTDKEVKAWVKNHFTDLPNVRAATKKDIKLLNNKRHLFSTTLEILQYHHLDTPHLSSTHLGWIKDNAYTVEHWDGETRIFYYLEHCGDLLVFSDYTADEIAKATIRDQFFRP